MKNLKLEILTVWLVLFFSTGSIIAQFQTPLELGPTGLSQMNLCGDNPGYEYRLLSGIAGGAASAIWHENTIDLTDGFREDFNFRFEKDPTDNRADGICFALSSQVDLGGTGGHLGYHGLPQTSLAVEIDVWQNGGLHDGSIPEDHTALLFGGNMNQPPIFPPVIIGTNGEIEDGSWHRASVRWDACNENFDVYIDNAQVIHYHGDIVANVFNNNPIVFWGFTAGKDAGTNIHDVCASPLVIDPCCSGVVNCDEEVDYTACAADDDFGYIALKCGVSFDWKFPGNSTALEYTTANQSVIVNASEGIYEVLLTDAQGCTEIRTYEILEDCCEEPTPECEAPGSVFCASIDHQSFLYWFEVPGAISYCLNIEFGGNNPCGCPGQGSIQIPDITNNFYPANLIHSDCFTWSVTAKCENGATSPSSASACFNNFTPCYQKEFDGPGTDGAARKIGGATVFPNPSTGTINVALDVKTSTNVSIEVYNADGKMIKNTTASFDNPGNYTQTLSLENVTQNGIYFVKIIDDQGNIDFQKVVIQQ